MVEVLETGASSPAVAAAAAAATTTATTPASARIASAAGWQARGGAARSGSATACRVHEGTDVGARQVALASPHCRCLDEDEAEGRRGRRSSAGSCRPSLHRSTRVATTRTLVLRLRKLRLRDVLRRCCERGEDELREGRAQAPDAGVWRRLLVRHAVVEAPCAREEVVGRALVTRAAQGGLLAHRDDELVPCLHERCCDLAAAVCVVQQRVHVLRARFRRPERRQAVERRARGHSRQGPLQWHCRGCAAPKLRRLQLGRARLRVAPRCIQRGRRCPRLGHLRSAPRCILRGHRCHRLGHLRVAVLALCLLRCCCCHRRRRSSGCRLYCHDLRSDRGEDAAAGDREQRLGALDGVDEGSSGDAAEAHDGPHAVAEHHREGQLRRGRREREEGAVRAADARVRDAGDAAHGALLEHVQLGDVRDGGGVVE